MKKHVIIAAIAALTLCGCGTIANRIADAIEPRLEALVDRQIEREEKMAGIWGTTNSYFYAETTAQETAIREEAEALVSTTMDQLLQQIDALISERMKGGK